MTSLSGHSACLPAVTGPCLIHPSLRLSLVFSFFLSSAEGYDTPRQDLQTKKLSGQLWQTALLQKYLAGLS
jgi:hypothetical protein